MRALVGSALFLFACAPVMEVPPDGGITDSAADAKKDVILPDSFMPSCDQVKACDGNPPVMGAQCVVSFDAQVIDLMGAPIVGETIYFCGLNICTPPIKSDGQGKVHVDVCWWYIQGAVKYLGGVKYVSFAAQAPSLQSMVTFPPLTLVPLPMAGADIPMAGGMVTSNNVALGIPQGATMKFDP